MKTIHWVLIACRVFVVSFGLCVMNSGCGDQGAPPGGVTTEEAKRNAESRDAMEANAKAEAAKHKK
jgi:hypothetical protein